MHETLIALIKNLSDEPPRADIDTVTYLLKKYPAFLNQTVDGQTLLFVAAAHGHNDIVRYLLRQKDIEIFELHDGKAPIHIAAHNGHREIVRMFLEHDLRLLNHLDKRGLPPLVYALLEERVYVVLYLLNQKGVDVNFLYSAPEIQDNHRYALLDYALEIKQFVVANSLIETMLRNSNEDHQDKIFDVIRTARVAVELMILNPSYRQLMLNHPRMRPLIDSSCYESDHLLHYFKPESRRPSFYVEINKNTGESTVFNKKDELGSGVNGCVVDFMSDRQEHRAVKYFDKRWIEFFSDDQVEQEYIQAVKETDLRCKVYPAPNVCFFFSRTQNVGYKKIMQCSKRDILDFIDGEPLNTYYKKVSTLPEVVNLFLLMIQEIKKTHGQGIIHGDIKEDNIMITSDSKVKLIDFGQAQFINGEKISTLGDPIQHRHIAPECFRASSSRVLTAAVTQDIYSLGYMLRFLYNYYNQKFDVNPLFPSIKKFIDQALDITPANRPNLDDFYTELTDEYHAVVMPLPAHSTRNCF